MVYTDCGLVVSEYRIDHGPEWRSFTDDDRNPARTGVPLIRLRHGRGLSTEIDRSARIRGRKRRQFACMRRQHNRAYISTRRERNQVYVFTEIHRVTNTPSLLNHIHDQACSLLESAQDEDLLHDRPLEGFAAICVYAACRVANVSRSVEEVCDMSKTTEAEHQAVYGAFNRDLSLLVTPADPTEYLSWSTTKLDLDSGTERRTREYIAEARGEGPVGGKNPYGVAVACLYTVASDRDEDYT